MADSTRNLNIELQIKNDKLKQQADESARVLDSSAKKMAGSVQQVRDQWLKMEAAQSQSIGTVQKWSQEFSSALAGPILKLGAAYEAAKLLSDTIKTGFAQNAARENLSIGLGAIISGTSNFSQNGQMLQGAQKFAAAQEVATQALDRFNIESIKTNYTGSQLAETAMTLSSVYMGLGKNTDQLVGFTTKLATAASATSLPLQQVARETDEILAGRITIQNVFYQRIKGMLDTGDLMKLKEGGTEAASVLEKALDRLSVAAAAHQHSWAGVTSTLNNVWEQFTRMATEPTFGLLEKELNGIADAMFEGEGKAKHLSPAITELARAFGILGKDMAWLTIRPAEGYLELFDLMAKGGSMALGGVRSMLHQDVLSDINSGGPLTGNARAQKLAELNDRVRKAAASHNGFDLSSAIDFRNQFLQDNPASGAKEVTSPAKESEKHLKDVEKHLKAEASAHERAQRAAERLARAHETAAERAEAALIHANQVSSQNDRVLQRLGIGGDDLIDKTGYSDTKGVHDLFAQHFSGAPDPSKDKLLKNIEAYQKWKDDEAKKWDNTFSNVLGFGVSAATDIIQARSGASGGESLRTWGGLAAKGVGLIPGAQLIAGGIGAVTSIGSAMMDQNDKNNDILSLAARGGLVNRSDLADAAANQGMGPLGWFGRGLADVVTLGSAEGGFQKQASSALASYDSKFATRFDHSMETGAKGQYDQAMDSLGDFADSLRKNKVPEGEITREVDAKRTLIEQTYKAAQAMEKMNQLMSGANGFMSVFSMENKLNGKTDTIDTLKSSFNAAGDINLANILGNRGAMDNVLREYDFGVLQGNDSDRQAFAKTFNLNADDTGALTKFFDTVIKPSFSQAIDMMGHSINIGQMPGQQQQLTMQAPQVQTLQIQMTNQWTIGGNIIGDRSAFQELARAMGVTLALQAGQSS